MALEPKPGDFGDELELAMRHDGEEIGCTALSNQGFLAIGTTGPAPLLVFHWKDGKHAVFDGVALSSQYEGDITALTFNHAGDVLLAGDVYGRVHVWDVRSQTELKVNTWLSLSIYVSFVYHIDRKMRRPAATSEL
jgi:WD40 repeat protein